MRDPLLRARLGRRSRVVAERRHDVDRMVARYEQILLKAMERPGTAPSRRFA